jgi:hypothetical protein
MIQYMKCGDKRRRKQLEYMTQKMPELIKNTSEKYMLKRHHVCVCECVCVCVCVCVTPLISFYDHSQ